MNDRGNMSRRLKETAGKDERNKLKKDERIILEEKGNLKE